jgi:hypothetical protein
MSEIDLRLTTRKMLVARNRRFQRLASRNVRRASMTRLALAAVLGVAAGLAVTATPARACDCATPVWPLRLESVEVSGPEPAHQAAWPARARLTMTSPVILEADEHRAGTLHRIQAGEWGDE